MTACNPQVQACAMRVTALDVDGSPLAGSTTMVVTDLLTTLTAKPVYEDGSEIIVKNACGTVGVDYKGDDSFKRLDIDLEVLAPDPYLHSLLTAGGVVLTDGGSGAVGFAYPPIGPMTTNGVSIELWSKNILNGALDPDFPYQWWVFPLVKNLRLGDRQFADAAQLSPFTGQALENANWLDGPANDWPVASDAVSQSIGTTTLPVTSCGFVVLAPS